jgi:hypothetical protein
MILGWVAVYLGERSTRRPLLPPDDLTIAEEQILPQHLYGCVAALAGLLALLALICGVGAIGYNILAL